MRGLIVVSALFTLLIISIVVGADTGTLPGGIKNLYDFPGGDKAGHFILFGLLGFLVNKSAQVLAPKRSPVRIILTVNLLLFLLVGLEEWTQTFFPRRTPSLLDLAFSYVGIGIFAWLAWLTNRKGM